MGGMGVGVHQQPAPAAEQGPPIDDTLWRPLEKDQALGHATGDFQIQPGRAGQTRQPHLSGRDGDFVDKTLIYWAWIGHSASILSR